MKTQHTPTPWKLNKEKSGQIENSNGYIIAQAYQNKTEDNAKHIVHCVNNHAALVEALERIIERGRNIPILETDFNLAKQALSQAKGGE